MSLDALKAMKEKMKAEKEAFIKGGEKYFRKSELEAAKLQRLREEEEVEQRKKANQELKRKQLAGMNEEESVKRARAEKTEHEQLLPEMPEAEVIRRLRALGHPATLFGEDRVARLRRFLKAEKEVAVEDETMGGQQENVMLGLQKQDKHKGHHKHEAAAKVNSKNAEEEAKQHKALSGPAAPGVSEQLQAAEARPLTPEEETQAAFARAAAQLADRRAEAAMCIEDRCQKWIKRWVKEWEEDLDRRPAPMKQSGSGHTTTLQFQQTKKYMEPLYERLKHRGLHEELRAGLWMMVEAMRNRNYMYANDIYLRLAIGNAPWPIGVTSVGIHERSAREKISHVMNQHGQAHIMNDEATRKFLQAMKRLLSAVQRMYPTDPSRSADFQTTTDLGRGVAGSGSHKQALLEAEARGETWQALGLSDAPHYLEEDGKVKVPPKWKHILDAEYKKERSPSPAL